MPVYVAAPAVREMKQMLTRISYGLGWVPERERNPRRFLGDCPGDPKYAKLELGRGILEGLGGAPEDGGMSFGDSKADPDEAASHDTLGK